MLDRRFAAVPALERGMLALFKDAIASYLGTEPTEVYRAYLFGDSSYGQHGQYDMIQSIPTRILATIEIVAVSCGDLHTGLVSKDGRAYMVGYGEFGRLGNGKDEAHHISIPFEIPGLPKVAIISCGQYHTGLLTKDGLVYTFGHARHGRLGHGIIDANVLTPRPLVGLEPVIDLSCGDEHTGLVTRDGRAYTFGGGTFGKLGNGTRSDSFTPFEIPELPKIASISCGRYNTGLVTRDGRAYVFGDNECGQVGNGLLFVWNNSNDVSIPFEIPGMGPVASISCGSEYTGIVTRDGRAYTFGRGDYGQLGTGMQDEVRSPRQIPRVPGVVTLLSCGRHAHTGLVTLSGNLYTCGMADVGQLGKGNGPNLIANWLQEPLANLPPVVSVSCGSRQTGVVTREILPRFPFNL
jgi:alpha-tubulin suppressor-like RCC1 family protein